MTPERLVLIAISATVASSFVSLLLSRSRTAAGWFAFLVTLGTAVLVMTAAVQVLLHGPSGRPEILLSAPRLGFALHVRVDGLTAVFLILAVVIAVPAAMHSIEYMRRYAGYGIAHYYPHLLFFLAAMYGLVSTTDMMWFLFIFWQMMTIPGYLLIRFEYRQPANVRAANRFLLMMQLGCAATMIGAEILAAGGGIAASGTGLKYSFEAVAANVPTILAHRPVLAGIAFALFFVGFGVKTGMWPFGAIWLPQAHPAAPTPVSAVFSGVMIKTGIYGMIRYFLCLVPASSRAEFPLAFWGTLAILVGCITMVTGTSTALRQDMTKRLLAYHSIGQVGYILLALGVCLVLLSHERPDAHHIATLALCAVLLHSFNHGIFKALLFLNAGALLHASDTQNLNKMGGLWRHMPLTAATALTASLAISGFPLFNGFVSKWMVYVAAIRAGCFAPSATIGAAIALFTSALTLASFLKFMGTGFLGQESETVRQRAARERSLEVGWLMQIPQLVLAAACLLTGLYPAWLAGMALQALRGTTDGIAGLLREMQPLTLSASGGVAATSGGAGYEPLLLLGVIAAGVGVAWLISRLGGAVRRRDEPWLCGYARFSDTMRCSAHGLYREMKRGHDNPREVSHGSS